jgi:hypothetical protein
MLEDRAATRRIESLKWANLVYDQRHSPITDPDHYYKTLHQQMANVLGAQRYNLLSEGYYRAYLDPRRAITQSQHQQLRTPRVDLAGIRYHYRQTAERNDAQSGDASY